MNWTHPESVMRLRLITDKLPHCKTCRDRYTCRGEPVKTLIPYPNDFTGGVFCCRDYKWKDDGLDPP